MRLAALLAFLGWCSVGCGPAVDAGLAKTRDSIVLDSKPTDAKSIEEAVVQVAPEMAVDNSDLDPSLPPGLVFEDEAVIEDEAETEEDPHADEETEAEANEEPGVGDPNVTILAQIGAGDFDPFEPDRAAFMLSEIPEDHDDQPGHDASKCPFCKQRAEKAPRAHVTLVGDDSQPIMVNASKLLSLSKGDQVIVQGTAEWDEPLNTLKVTASGIYLVK
jgi:hypothetical protein